MSRMLVDSSVLIAASSARDQDHEPGARIVHAIDRGDLPVGIVTDYLVMETLNFVHARMGQEKANELLDRLAKSAGFELVPTPARDFSVARSVFHHYPRLSFGDATIVAAMRRMEMEFCYSFDADFDAVEELTRLHVPENPYA